MSDILRFTDKLPKYNFMLNTYETKFMIDNNIFHHILGYIYYRQYLDDGNIVAAQHILGQESSLYCKMYRKRNPIKKCTEEMWNVDYTSEILERVIFHKFLSNKILTAKLIAIPQTAMIYINANDTIMGCTSDREGHNILGRTLTIVKSIIGSANIFRELHCSTTGSTTESTNSRVLNSDREFTETD